MANRNDHVMTNDGLRRMSLTTVRVMPQRRIRRTFTAPQPTPIATPTVTSKPGVLSAIASAFRRWFGMR